MILMRLGFLFTDLSQHYGIDLVVFPLKFFIHGRGGEGWHKAIYVVKLKVIQPQPKYKTRKFQNLIRKILLRGIHWNQKTNRNFKVLLGQILSTINIIEFLVCVFSYLTITFNVYFYEQMFLEVFVAKRDTGQFFFWEIIAMNSTIFINKPPRFLKVVVLIL